MRSGAGPSELHPQPRQRPWRKILAVVFGLIPAAMLGCLAGPLVGFAGFNDERAWPTALTIAFDALVLCSASILLLVCLEREAWRPRTWIVIGCVLTAAGSLGAAGGGYLLWARPGDSREDIWFAAALMALHSSAAAVLVTNGCMLLRESRVKNSAWLDS